MKCEYCKSENLEKRYVKSLKLQAFNIRRYFKYCKDCGYNSYYNFPEYLHESQFDKFVEQSTKKGVDKIG